MSGRLECHADGAALTITRATRRQTAPMADFQAVYTGTASPVEGLTGANCGETLLGVLESAVLLAVFALSIAFLVSGSYNPFLYFRF